MLRFKTALAALSAVSILPLLPLPAHSTPLVTNGSFASTTLTTKGRFLNNVTGWTGGGTTGNPSLTFLDTPGTADNGSYLSVYGPFPTTSPDGGNFVMMDGDPSYSGAISQVINGLVIGAHYSLGFYQAAGQQSGFTGSTTERWQVSLGTNTQLSSLYSLPQGGIGLWQQQTLNFVAYAATETLSFLAVGTPNGAPPISFLDGVSLTQVVPEPMALSILGAGLLGTLALRRRAKPTS